MPMEKMDAMKGVNQALRDLAQARGELQNLVTAALAFRAAVSGKTGGVAGQASADAAAGVARARRHELETSLDYLERLEAAVEEARRAVARAERAWLSQRRARLNETGKGGPHAER